MRRSAGAMVALALVIVTVGCSGDNDDQPAASDTADTSIEPGTGSATATTVASQSTEPPASTAPPEPTAAAARRRPVRGIPDDLEVAGASALVPAEPDRPFVLVGFNHPPGRMAVPRLWRSRNGIQWSRVSAPGTGANTRPFVLSATWFRGGLAVAGGTADARPRAAVWVAANGWRFDRAEDPFGGDRAGVDVVGALGTRLIAAGYVDTGEGAIAAVAVRGTGGRWVAADVPRLPQFTANGVVARGRTVVVTGVVAERQPSTAAALLSTDGGRTFRLANTEDFGGRGASELGPVAVTSRGFVAVACAPTRIGQVTALARSRDGRRWTRQDIDVVSTGSTDELSLADGGCDSLTIEGDTVVVGVVDLGGWVVYVNPNGTAVAGEIPRVAGQVAEQPPLVATRADGSVVAVGRDAGGFSPSVGGRLGRGLPDASVYVSDVELVATQLGPWLALDLYPKISELGEEGWQRGSFGRWFIPDDGGLRLARKRTVPPALDTALLVSYGLIGINDAAPDPRDDALDGPNRGTEAFLLRRPGRPWRSVGLIASGAGGDDVRALARSGRTVVGVGVASRREASGADVAHPIAVSTRNGERWRTERVPVRAGGEGGLYDVCAAAGRVVAVGYQIVDGVQQPLVVGRRNGRWRPASTAGLPKRVDPVGCAAAGDRLLVYADGLDRSEVYVSVAGGEFQRAALGGTEFRDTGFTDFAASGRTFYAAGRTYDGVDDDAALWRSRDGLTWTPIDVRGLGGRGDQDALSIVVDDRTIVVAGLSENAPVVWDVPID